MDSKEKTNHNIRLTSAEVSSLWTTYMNNTMSRCVLRYFLSKVEDTEIGFVIKYALHVSEKIVDAVIHIFEEEQYPIPVGFNDQDVNLNAPRLFADEFFLNYIDQMAKSGFIAYGAAASMSARLDIQKFFNECIQENIEINKQSKAVLLSKGLMLRPPHIDVPKRVDFVKHQNFLTGWFGERKPLLAIEITNLFHNLQTNAIGKALITGFAQVADTENVRDYFKRGNKIAKKHTEVFSSLLTAEDIPVQRTWADDILDSTESPFSDKLMLFHISILSASGIGNYGQSMATCTRGDLITHFSRLLLEIGQFAEDGANIMIKYGWMEEPPQSTDRNKLIQK